jgi:hypothetical protein
LAGRKGGFPHSEICGSKGARASPQLIAACHVLHRLSMPRHPSEALMRLIVLSKTHARGRSRPPAGAGARNRPNAWASYYARRCSSSDLPSKPWRGRTNPSFTMSPSIHPKTVENPVRCDRFTPKGQSCLMRGGARRDRTDDLMLAKHALYQLSYGPLKPPRPSCEPVVQIRR